MRQTMKFCTATKVHVARQHRLRLFLLFSISQNRKAEMIKSFQFVDIEYMCRQQIHYYFLTAEKGEKTSQLPHRAPCTHIVTVHQQK